MLLCRPPHVTLLLAVFCGLAGTLQAQTERDFAAAINVAGRQRMLTQKMTKEACLIALEVNVEVNRERLHETMALFETSLERLLEGDNARDLPPPPADFIHAQLELLRLIWGEFRELVLAAAQGDRAALRAIAEDSLVMLRETNAAVGMYVDVALLAGARDLGRVVNIAGRQRMLSQKMAKEALFLALDIHPENHLAMLGRTHAIFARSHTGLMEGDLEYGLPPTEDPDIRAQMARVHEIWTELAPVVEGALAGEALEPAALEQLDALALRLLEAMHEAVGMYEALAAG